MLLDEYPRRQRFHRIVVQHRNGRLQDDRPAVQLGRHEVHGRAADADAILERLPLRVKAGKRRQQRRVDVQHPIGERREQRTARRGA